MLQRRSKTRADKGDYKLHGSPVAHNYLFKQSAVYPQMPSIYDARSSASKSYFLEDTQSYKAPILSINMSPREKKALYQHQKIKKIEKEMS